MIHFADILIEEFEKKVSEMKVQNREVENLRKGIDKKVDQYLDRIGEAKSQEIISKYEERIYALEKQKKQLVIQIVPVTQETVRTAIENICAIVTDTFTIWKEGTCDQKTMLLQLIFDGPIFVNEK